MQFRFPSLISLFVLGHVASVQPALSDDVPDASHPVGIPVLRPVTGLTPAQRQAFDRGSILFGQVWSSGDSSSKFDGAGPLYNARACNLCHPAGGAGHAPGANWPDGDQLSFVLRLSVAGGSHPVYGRQLQDFGAQGLKPEGKIRVTYTDLAVSLSDGETAILRSPQYSVDMLGYGPLGEGTVLSPRIAPPLFGIGLLAAISPAELPNGTVGRFGWRAETLSLRDQIAAAFSSDMGLSTALYPSGSGDCTSAERECVAKGNSVSATEVSETVLNDLQAAIENLSPLQGITAFTPLMRKGKTVFDNVGCPACHRETFTTPNIPEKPALSNRTIHPYSDLRLHEMGEGLADRTVKGSIDLQQWRTAPLWGLTRRKTALLHDGRARNPMEAILWHGGEASASQKAVIDLHALERYALIAFLEGL